MVEHLGATLVRRSGRLAGRVCDGSQQASAGAAEDEFGIDMHRRRLLLGFPVELVQEESRSGGPAGGHAERTVVSGGVVKSAPNMSSKPTMLIWSGTTTPAEWSSCISPMARRSLYAMTAVAPLDRTFTAVTGVGRRRLATGGPFRSNRPDRFTSATHNTPHRRSSWLDLAVTHPLPADANFATGPR